MVPLIATLLSGAFSLASNRSQWNQQQRALAAQKKENEKMREYNMQLAQQQNQWNLEQWQRENEARKQATADERAYNSPSAQKARLMAAGLNPDMMYGQGGVQNTSAAASVAASPEMSAGAPATPMDWSSLANRRTIGDSIMQSLAIRQAEANIKKTEGEAKQAGINADILDKYGLETAELNREKVREELNKLAVEAKSIDLNSTEAQVKHIFFQTYHKEYVENMLQRLTTSTQMSANALKEDIETLALRIAGINAENSRLDRMSKFTTDEWRLVFDVVRALLGGLK